MNKNVLWHWRKRAVEQGLNISSRLLKITSCDSCDDSCDVILSRTTAAHSARSWQTFHERAKGKEERTRICRSAFVEKNSWLRVEEISLAFLRIRMSIISDAFHVYFALLLNLWTPPLPRLNLRMLVSLKDLAPEWTCMASWKTRVNCYQMCVCLSDHLLGWVVWVILKNIYPANWFQGGKNSCKEIPGKKILKNKTTSGYRLV